MGNLDIENLARIASFRTFPETVPVSALRLASSGFRYGGDGDRVVCPLCGLVIEHWSPDGRNPVEEHRLRSPQCSLATHSIRPSFDAVGQLRELDKLASRSPAERPPSMHRSDSGGPSTGNAAVSAPSEHTTPPKHSDSSAIVDVFRSALERARTHGVFDNDAELPPAAAVSAVPSASVPFPVPVPQRQQPPPIDRLNPDFDRLRFESARLATFDDWPALAPVEPEALVRTGLFYTGQNDRVRCAFCRGVLHRWVRGDDPDSEHRRHFPDCPFVRGLDVGNVRRTDDNEQSVKTAHVAVGSSVSRQAAPSADVIREVPNNVVNALRTESVTAPSRNAASAAEDERRTTEASAGGYASRADPSEDAVAAMQRRAMNGGNAEEEVALMTENQRLKELRTCKVCMDREVNTVFLPCGHLVACDECSPKLRNCPICRTFIRGTVKTFLS